MSALVPSGRPPSIIDVFKAMDDDANRKDPSRPARLAEEKRLKVLAQEAERVEIIARYGSKEAAIAGGEANRRLRAAADPFRRTIMYQFDNGRFPRESLDGWAGGYDPKKAPHRVRVAVENALPLPATIAEAALEHNYWRRRNEELESVYENRDADTLLPLECTLRANIVQDLLETGLRAVSLQDAIIRQRYAVELEIDSPDVTKAVLEDLENLAAGSGP